MKTKEQVIEWLKSKEWFEQFKANVEKVHSVERFLDWFYDYTIFFAAFDWADTPKGNAFWYKKCAEFMNWWNNETIEERATEYARCAQNCEGCGEDECLQENFRCDHFRRVYYAFINGANEQKQIDIDKACEWLRAREVLRDASIERFREEMEE